MTTSYIPQEGTGGGGGSGTVTSVNVSGGTTGMSFGGGPITTAGTMTMSGVLDVDNGGTGQSNQQAALNNLTNTAGATANDILAYYAGNAQFVSLGGLLGLTGNRFVFTDGTGNIITKTGWDYYTNTNGMNVNLDQSVDNTGGYTVHNLNTSLTPTLASPTSQYNLFNVFGQIDPTSTGFAMGTGGNLSNLFNVGFNHQGTSNIGSLNLFNSYSNIGNGTDPIDIKGYNGFFIFGDFNDNVNISAGFQGYIFQPHVHSLATTTPGSSYSQIFGDFSNIECTVDGWTSFSSGPAVAAIRSNSSIGSYVANPNIGTIAANSGYIALGMSSNITTMNANSYVSGLQFNPNITTSQGTVTGIGLNPNIIGGTADVTLIQGNMNQVNSSSSNQYVLSLSGQLPSGAMSGCSIDGVRFNVSGVLTAASAQTIQSQHVIFTQFITPDATAITGTDILMNILSPDVDFGDATSSIALGPSGLGVNMVAFAGQTHGSGSVALFKALSAGAVFLEDFTCTEWRGVDSLLINAGYTGATTNAIGFYHEVTGAGVFATNHWGIKMVGDIDNYVGKLAINTSNQKVSGANVKLDVFDGHLHVDQTTPPTIAANANAGTGASAALTDASDVAGKIQLTMGSGSFSAGVQCTITFDKAYDVAPVVVFSAANQAAVSSTVHHEIYVDNVTTTSFDISFGVQENTAGTVYRWNYFVMGV